jgi:WXG100 family type VII secretion target
MTRFQVDSEAVVSATSAIRAASGRIQGEVGGLLAQLTALQGTWTGQASIGFQSVIGDWKATQARVEESLALISTALGQAGQSYAEVEAANARLFVR